MTEQKKYVNARHCSYAQTPSKVGSDHRWGPVLKLTYLIGKVSQPHCFYSNHQEVMVPMFSLSLCPLVKIHTTTLSFTDSDKS